MVDVISPPRITIAIGDCISLPGSVPRKASGTRARAEVSAVIIIGRSLSDDPLCIRSSSGIPFCFNEL